VAAAASRELKALAFSGMLLQAIRLLLKETIYCSLSFWMMYCVITEKVKGKTLKIEMPV
jgi:hypothetical protein